jgi:hypothetical protein
MEFGVISCKSIQTIMMKFKKYLTLACLFFLAVTTYPQKSVFKLDIDSKERLPALLLDLNQEGIASAYNSSIIHSSTNYYNNDFSEELVSTTSFGDKKVTDLYNLIEQYHKTYLCDESDSVMGRIQMNLLFYDYDYQLTAGFYINVFTLGVGYLLGIPADKATTIVELTANIYDLNQNPVAVYSGFGKEVKRNGLYYRKKSQRFQNLDALKKAIYEINDQITANYDMIVLKLHNSKE